jgi:hypothetical protein
VCGSESLGPGVDYLGFGMRLTVATVAYNLDGFGSRAVAAAHAQTTVQVILTPGGVQ